MFDQDPDLKRSRIRILIKDLSIFIPKKLFLSSRDYDPGFFRIPDPDPGSRGQKGTGFWIRNSDAKRDWYSDI
jgi:hypothetical protein